MTAFAGEAEPSHGACINTSCAPLSVVAAANLGVSIAVLQVCGVNVGAHRDV